MPSYIKLVSGVFSIALLLLAAPPAPAIDLWEAHTGNPPSIPPEEYRHLDANQACVSEGSLSQPYGCYVNPRNLRAEFYGNPSASAAECVHDMTCLCPNECGGNGNTVIFYAGATSKKPAPLCPDGTMAFLGRCDADTPKGKGPCPDCGLQQGNPANIASGNKYQREPIYREMAELEIDVTKLSPDEVTEKILAALI